MARLSDEEETSSSSDSDTGSDESSVYTILDNPPQRARIIAQEANGYSAEYFIKGGATGTGGHFLGKLVDNRAKRKLRSDADDSNRAAKTLRLDAYHIPLTAKDLAALNRQDSQDSDYHSGMAEEEEEEDEKEDQKPGLDLPLLTSDVHRNQTAKHRSAVQQQSNESLLPGTQHQQPSADKMTVFDLMRQQLSRLSLRKQDVQEKFRFLADLPVKRVPILTRGFKTYQPQNTISYLIQASGILLPDEDSCEICLSSRGIYQGCVVTKDPIVNESLQGACAGCWYGRKAYQCSLRQSYEAVSQSSTPEPVPQLSPPPPPKQTQPEPRAEQTPKSPAASRFQDSLRPSTVLEVQLKSTPVSTSHVEHRPTPVPIPQAPQKSTPVPVPQLLQKSTPVPVPQPPQKPTPVPIPLVQQTWKQASGAQLQETPKPGPVPKIQEILRPFPVSKVQETSKEASVAQLQELGTPKPGPVSKVQETWKPVTISPVPIPVPPTMRRSSSGESQKSTPAPAQIGNGSGTSNGTATGASAVRKETPVPPPKYAPMRPPNPPTSSRTDPPASSSSGGDRNSDQFTGLSVGLSAFTMQTQLSKKDRVDGWKKQYEQMSPNELQATMEHLTEWNAECGIRMEAMMSVLMKKSTSSQTMPNGT